MATPTALVLAVRARLHQKLGDLPRARYWARAAMLRYARDGNRAGVTAMRALLDEIASDGQPR